MLGALILLLPAVSVDQDGLMLPLLRLIGSANGLVRVIWGLFLLQREGKE